MSNPKGKKSFRAWLYPETIDMINNNYKKIHCRSRSQFIDRAVDFYTGYINADDDSYYIPKAILSNLHGIVDMAESRINRMEFRNCVELAMIESILAVTNDIHRGKNIKPENNYFQCSGYQRSGHLCTIHRIKENVINQIVLDNLRKVTAFARNDPDKFYEIAMKRGKAEAAKIEKVAVKQKSDNESRLKQLDSIIRCLYEDRVVGRITPERYDEMVVGYENEMAELKRKLTELNNDLTLYSQQQQAIKDFIAKAKEYVEMPKLTAELLHTFIQRVDVYEKPVKYKHDAGHPVMIYYKFQMTRSERFATMFGLEPDDFSIAANQAPNTLDFTA